MRRSSREPQSPGLFRGAELVRLATGVVMLAVLYMLIVRTGDADSWRWLVGDGVQPASTAKPAGPNAEPPAVPAAAGPTDEDPDQAATAREEFQAVTDGTLTLQPEEMESYDRLVDWAKNQSFAQLARRTRSDLLFTNFYDQPERYRGQLVTLELNVRRILSPEKNRYGTQLHEVWGFSSESRDRLYVAMVVGLPKGMPIGPSLSEKAKFAGYFFKLQGYHAPGAKPGAVPDKSPLLIGRLQWEPAVAPAVDRTRERIWGLALLALIAAAVGLPWVYRRWFGPKPGTRPAMADPGSGEVIPIEAWLDRAGFGTPGELDDDKDADR